MTKTDFEAIAHTLDANVAPLSLVLDMADTFEEANPRFDRHIFIEVATRNLVQQHEHNARMLNNALTKEK